MPDLTKHDAPLASPRPESADAMADPSALARLLDEWMRGDEVEQRETFEALRRLLDEDRTPGCKLFP